MASSINVRESLVNPSLYYYNNTIGSLCLLQAMLASGISYIVFSSTAAVYGTPHHTPMGENHPLAPLNAYGKSKRAVEDLLDDFFNAHGISYAALRYFNACGADAEGRIGEAHAPETHLIPLIIKKALVPLGTHVSPLAVFGDDYDTPDGTAIRDYVHVTDLATAHVKAVDYLLKRGEPIKLNLGTGRGFSVKEVIAAVSTFSGRDIPYEIQPRLAHDSPSLVADATQAQNVLQWTAKHSDLSTIIESAWKWHSSEAPSINFVSTGF